LKNANKLDVHDVHDLIESQTSMQTLVSKTETTLIRSKLALTHLGLEQSFHGLCSPAIWNNSLNHKYQHNYEENEVNKCIFISYIYIYLLHTSGIYSGGIMQPPNFIILLYNN
jgi:hypothetical protein